MRREVSPRFDKFSESKLASLVESYLDIARGRPLVIPASLGATDIYPDSRAMPLPLSIVQQLAIYVGKIYIHDPLLDLAYEWPQLDYTMPLLVKYKTRPERVAYFRRKLRSVLEELMLLEPLIEAGIVHLTPGLMNEGSGNGGVLIPLLFHLTQGGKDLAALRLN
jgi:hypothetical protein